VDLSARPSGSSTYPLDIFAALSADKKMLTISLVNPTETAQDCDLTLTGAQPVGGAKFWQLTAPPGKSAASTGFGPSAFAGPPANMAERLLPQAPGSITLPPASISVYEFGVEQ
jgi:alpha-N-arabinofuranosidase